MSRTHLAGIIPVAGLKTDYDIDTPEILIPLEAGFTAIQKSVYECALAGCNTIWIIANQDMAPIVRKTVVAKYLFTMYQSTQRIETEEIHMAGLF